MGQEIERKFLVENEGYTNLAKPKLYRQGYLSTTHERTVRVRVIDKKGYITIKGSNKGAVRDEYEYEIPLNDANNMLDDLCYEPIIEKYRYKIEVDKDLWEVDQFIGVNEGLVIAEIELETESKDFKKPDWIGQEVTGDLRYYNSNLVENPYKTW